MHFVLILAALVATTLAEKAPDAAVEHAAARCLFALGAMLLAPVLAATMSAVVVRGIQQNAHDWATWMVRFAWGQQLHAGLLVLLVGAISYGLAWPQIVRVNLGLGNWILLDDLLILAPVYVPLLLSWAVFYDVDRAVYELTAEDDASSLTPGRAQYVLLHARHYLGLVLAPLLVVLGVYDAARWLAPEFTAGPHNWLLMTPLFAVLVACMPWLLALLWKTETMPPGEQRTYLMNVLRECRFHVRDIHIWHTDSRMTNAAVSGLWPTMRYVFLTDRLLEVLEDDEVAAVLRHEAGHVVRHHLLLRMLLLGLPIVVWIAIWKAMPDAVALASETLARFGVSPYMQETVLLPCAVALYGLFVLGGYCKLLEFEADLFAAEANTPALIKALCKITAESGVDRRREGWLHPSIVRRIGFVHRVRRSPSLARRFRWRMRAIALAIGAGYLLRASNKMI
jgi:Zn-dependent protease with chaperone function